MVTTNGTNTNLSTLFGFGWLFSYYPNVVVFAHFKLCTTFAGVPVVDIFFVVNVPTPNVIVGANVRFFFKGRYA